MEMAVLGRGPRGLKEGIQGEKSAEGQLQEGQGGQHFVLWSQDALSLIL